MTSVGHPAKIDGDPHGPRPCESKTHTFLNVLACKSLWSMRSLGHTPRVKS